MRLVTYRKGRGPARVGAVVVHASGEVVPDAEAGDLAAE